MVLLRDEPKNQRSCLRGGPPSVDGEQSNRKFNQINCEHHQLIVQNKGPTFKII